MTAKIALDLRGVIFPLDLLKCKSRLQSMKEGEVLDLILGDEDVARDLITIVQRSKDRIIYNHKKTNHICLGIQKGKRSGQ
ncbi:sulfurtransferase TusA family protein [Desulfospira joergensenii]|uniref:sulfurtransferase TusA family protein n=1 Tax=Desulfospira joergensenii TaxID=53329 RepID=UPI0003B39874|nr:sulfurtransferase TusA family protein [Desulfospira joergensenii]